MNNKTAIIFAMSISAIFTIIILNLNIFVLESSLNGYATETKRIDNINLQNEYNLHKTHAVFSMRPLTNLFTYSLSSLFNISISISLLIIFGFFILLDGILIYILSKNFNLKPIERIFSILIFYLSFHILFSFSATLHTYDEPVHYAFIFISLIYYFKQKYVYFAFGFTLALVARETSIFLVPALLFLEYKRGMSLRPILVSFLAAGIMYLSFYLNYLRYIDFTDKNLRYFRSERFNEWKFSFQDIQHTKESLIMFFITLFPSVALLLHKLRSKSRNILTSAFLITFLINTPIAFFTARAQESRIFALPLVWIWPLLGNHFSQFVEDLKIRILNRWKPVRIIDLIIVITFAFWIAFIYFDPTHVGNARFAYQAYLFSELLVWMFVLLLPNRKRFVR